MADAKISALTDGTTPADADAFPVARSGANRKLTWSQLKAALPWGVSSPAGGQIVQHDGTDFKNINLWQALWGGMLPSGVLAASYPPIIGISVNSVGLTSGTLWMQGIHLPKGLTVTSIGVRAGQTALSSGTHQYFGLFDDSSGTSSGTPRALLRGSVDDTSTAWAAYTDKVLALTSTYQTTRSGLFYIGVLVTASTTPSIIGGQATLNLAANNNPVLYGNSSSTGLSALPNPAGAISASNAPGFVYVK